MSTEIAVVTSNPTLAYSDPVNDEVIGYVGIKSYRVSRSRIHVFDHPYRGKVRQCVSEDELKRLGTPC